MKNKYEMTGHKLYWHLDRVNDWLNDKRVTPIHIELGITSGCNLACSYCYGHFIGQEVKKYDMPKEVIFKLFEDAKQIGIKSITLIGEGENTIHRDFYDILDHARKAGIDLAIATNGVALKRDKILEFLKSFVWIRFSIAASSEETYTKIHGKNKFKKVIRNIKQCVEMKKKYDLNTTIGMQMVLLNENKKEIVPLAKLGNELSVDYFVIKPCSDTYDKQLSVNNEMYLEMNDIFRKAEQYSNNNYSVIIKWDKLSNLGLNRFSACYGTIFTIAIDAHGNVAPCGHLLGYRKDEFKMGNIIEESIAEIIKSDKYWEVQKKVQRELDVNKECESNCLHNAMNIFLDKLKHPPDHINFP